MPHHFSTEQLQPDLLCQQSTRYACWTLTAFSFDPYEADTSETVRLASKSTIGREVSENSTHERRVKPLDHVWIYKSQCFHLLSA